MNFDLPKLLKSFKQRVEEFESIETDNLSKSDAHKESLLSLLAEGVELARSCPNSAAIVLLDYVAKRLHSSGQSNLAMAAWADAHRIGNSLELNAKSPSTEAWLIATVKMARILSANGQYRSAVDALEVVRRRCRKYGIARAESVVDLELANTCSDMQDHDAACMYTREFAALLEDNNAIDGKHYEFVDYGAAAQIVGKIAFQCCYENKDYGTAIEFASLVLRLSPDDYYGYSILSNAQIESKKLDDAYKTLEAACGRYPDDPTFHFTWGRSLMVAGELNAALPHLGRAIELRPIYLPYWYRRGLTLRCLARHQEAIADFDVCIALFNIPQSIDASSQEEQINFRHLAGAAAINRAGSRARLGMVWEALESCRVFFADDDIILRTSALIVAGEIHLNAGDDDEALASWTAALNLRPYEGTVLISRAKLLIKRGDYERALSDFAFLADSNHRRQDAIDGISELINISPKLPGAWRWRGYAYVQGGQTREAADDLTHAVELDPTDADAFYWRGLARIRTSVESAWEESFNEERLIQALNDLATACRLNPSFDAAHSAYRWIIDRMSTDQYALRYLVDFTDRFADIFTIIPDLKTALDLYFLGRAAAEKLQSSDAIELFRSAQAKLLEAGLPVFACQMHLHLAGSFLCLGDLQSAFDHIADAESIVYVIFQPLSTELRSKAAENSNRTYLQIGEASLSIEPEYFKFYEVGLKDYLLMVRVLKAQTIYHAGNAPEAAKILKPLRQFLNNEEIAKWPLATLHAIVTILRGADRPRLALRILKRLHSRCTNEIDRMKHCHLRATLWAVLRRPELAFKWYRRAYHIARKERYRDHIEIALNLAYLYRGTGALQKALKICDRVAKRVKHLSAYDQYAFYRCRCIVLADLRRMDEAQSDILVVLDTIEKKRSGLRQSDAKIKLTETYQYEYEIAVRIAIDNGDSRTAFELLERSRARAFLDQLETSSILLPVEAQELNNIERTLIAQLALIDQVSRSSEHLGKNLVEIDAIKELIKKHGFTDLVEPSTNRLLISKLDETRDAVTRRLTSLRERKEKVRLSAHKSITGSPVRFDQCLAFLDI